MEEDIKILEEFLETAKIHTSIIPDINFEPFYKEQVQALENLLTRYKQLDSLIGEIDNKEASDALHTLLHCALTNKDFETQKQQFQIVNAYIKQLEEENKRLNNHNIIGRIDAIKIEDLEPVLKPYYIPKSKVKEKIEELDKRIKSVTTEDEYKNLKIYTCKDFNEFITSVLQEFLREE